MYVSRLSVGHIANETRQAMISCSRIKSWKYPLYANIIVAHYVSEIVFVPDFGSLTRALSSPLS